MNYVTLKSAIQQVVKTNGNNEITGALLQQSLLTMIDSLGSGYQFKGVATPTTVPGTPDQRVFYIAEPGTYPNFGNTVVGGGKIGVFRFDSEWSIDFLEFSISDGSITTAKLADGAVVTVKIANGAVTKQKLSEELQREIEHPVEVGSASNADLDFADDAGYILVRFSNGHIRTKYFDSANPVGDGAIDTYKLADGAVTKNKLSEELQTEIEHPVSTGDASETDLDIGDESGNVIVRFSNGHIRTKYFDSENLDIEHPVAVENNIEDADLDFADENGNVIARLENGHIRTRNFNSSNTIGYTIID